MEPVETSPTAPLKDCRGNRYCSRRLPFHRQRLLVLGAGPPAFTGRCYCDGCGRFVCNRCAHRRPPDPPPPGLAAEAWVLCCPFDGAPLGDGDEWLVLTPGGAILDRFSGTPGDYRPDREKILGGQRAELLESFGLAMGLLGAALEILEEGEPEAAVAASEQALSVGPGDPLALMVQRSALEAAGRREDAWRVLQRLLDLEPLALAAATLALGLLGDLERAGAEVSETAAAGFRRHGQELQALLGRPRVPLPRRPEGVSDGALDPIPPPRAWWTAGEPRPPARGAALSRQEIDQRIDLRYGRVVEHHHAGGRGPTLLLLSHEVLDAGQQRSLYLQLENLLGRQPDLPVLLEGTAGPRQRRDVRPIGDPARRRRETLDWLGGAPGRLAGEALARFFPAAAMIHGADDADLLADQQRRRREVMEAIHSALPRGARDQATPEAVRDAALQAFSALLREVEGNALSGPLRDLLTAHAAFRRGEETSGFVRALVPRAEAAGIALSSHPALAAYWRAMEVEDRLDFAAAEQQRAELVDELAGRLTSPLSEEQREALARWIGEASPAETPSVAAAAPSLPWWKRRRRSRRGGRPPQEGAGADPDWFDRLLALSLAVRQGTLSQGRYYELLSGLLTALEMDLPAGGALRDYVDYCRLADSIDRDRLLGEEIPALTDQVLDALASTAVDVGMLQLRRQLADLDRLFRFRLPADRVRPVLGGAPSPVEWLKRLLQLGELRLAEAWSADPSKPLRQLAVPCAGSMETAVRPLRDFYASACRRSVEILKRAVASQGAESGALALVCARFHLHGVLEVLRSESDLSWAVVVPIVEREGKAAEGWIFLDEEAVLP